MDSIRKKALLDALHVARKRETEAFNFYQKALHKAPFSETRALLMQLAEEERKHRYFIQQEIEKIDKLLRFESGESYIDDKTIEFEIPQEIPFMRLQSIPGIDLAAVSMPSELIGGDYLDTIILKKGNGRTSLGLFLYDVMGHGVASTQLKASAKSVFGKLREDWGLGEAKVNLFQPGEVMRFLNQSLIHRCKECSRFITVFYGVVDMDESSLLYASAGHEPPILIRVDRGYEALEDTDLLLGADEEVEYSSYDSPFDKGDIMALFSDGITEAGHPDEGMFSRHGLCQTVFQNKEESSGIIVEECFLALKQFLKGASLTDDCSLAVLKKTE